MFESSVEIKNIANALSLFHAEVGTVTRNKQGYNYMYATLPNVLEVVAEPLEKAGLVFSQFPVGEYGLVTMLIHSKSGEFFKTESFIEPVTKNPQTIGSVITYLRRYHLVSILGLNVDDDDGRSATISSSESSDSGYSKTDSSSNKSQRDDGKTKPWLNQNDPKFESIVNKLQSGDITLDDVKKYYKLSKQMSGELTAIINSGVQSDSVDF